MILIVTSRFPKDSDIDRTLVEPVMQDLAAIISPEMDLLVFARGANSKNKTHQLTFFVPLDQDTKHHIEQSLERLFNKDFEIVFDERVDLDDAVALNCAAAIDEVVDKHEAFVNVIVDSGSSRKLEVGGLRFSSDN